MSVWNVEENGKRHLFVCGPCAIEFYNAGRATRTAPEETEPKEGEKVEGCFS